MDKVKKVVKSIISDAKFPNDVIILLSFYDENDDLVLSEKRLTIDGNIDLQDILKHKSHCCGLILDGLIIE